jgi:serine/threonine protein kinase
MREIDTWYNCQHSNIMPLLGIVRKKGSIYMVTEWAKNGTLRDYLKVTPEASRVEMVCADRATD